MKIEDYFEIGKYEIIDGLINTSGGVTLIKEVKQLPFKFGKIGGYFNCYNNQLTSLIGVPKSVTGDFNCFNNQLTSLEGAPKSVGGHFNCSNNQLTSLINGPISVGGFDCCYNQLTSLIGAPKSVGGYFDCNYNQLISLEGAPTTVGGTFYCSWSKDLPLLRLVTYKEIEIKVFKNQQVNKIINNYCGQKPLKKAILDCQKYLIENGYVGNARW
jgi:hypothetical protein